MALHDIPAGLGLIIGLCISLVLYGVYCVLFAVTLYTRRKCDNNNHLVTWAVVALFAICTTIMALHISIYYNTLIQLQTTDPATRPFLGIPWLPYPDWYPVRDLLLLCSNVVAECLLIWRLYIIWLKDWKILIAPGLGMLALASTGIVATVFQFMIFDSLTPRAEKLIPIFCRIASVEWMATMSNNLICTILMVWKLWHISRTAVGRGTAELANPAASALIESGALYTGTLLCLSVISIAGLDNGRRMIFLFLPVIIGIAPTSIILRLNLIATQKSSETVQNVDLVLPSTLPSVILGNFAGRNEPVLVRSEGGTKTLPEPVFVRPMSGYSSFTSGDLSVDLEDGFGKETMHDKKSPDSLVS